MADKNRDKARLQALKYIEACTDAPSLRRLIKNARTIGEDDVERAAELRLFEILPAAQPGTLEHDVWRSIHALESTLTSERHRTTLLNRTRPKIAREGEVATVAELVLKKKASDGFHMLMERNMADLTFEAVALRHPDDFEQDVLDAARARLLDAGYDFGGDSA
jgi:hypothetical protein